MYLKLMENGISMVDIDNQDMYFYMKLLRYKESKELQENAQKLDGLGL